MRVRAAELVGNVTHLRTQGPGHLTGLCPLHSERTPSFHIRFQEGAPDRWHCFGCDEGGDVIDLAMHLMRCNHVQAIEQLAQHAGIELQSAKTKPKATREVIDESKSLYRENQKEVHVIVDRFGLERGVLSPEGQPLDHEGGAFGMQFWAKRNHKGYLVRDIKTLWVALQKGIPAAYLYGDLSYAAQELRHWGIESAALIDPQPAAALLSLPENLKASIHMRGVHPSKLKDAKAYIDEHELLVEHLPKHPKALAQQIYAIRERLLGDDPFDEQAMSLRTRIASKTGITLSAIESVILHGPDASRIIAGRQGGHEDKHALMLGSLLHDHPELEAQLPLESLSPNIQKKIERSRLSPDPSLPKLDPQKATKAALDLIKGLKQQTQTSAAEQNLAQ